MNQEDEAKEDNANIDLDSQRKGKCVVLKTSTKQVTKLGISFRNFTTKKFTLYDVPFMSVV